MTIRARLSWTFTLLIVLGVTAIASFSIWFIRDFLTAEGKRQMARDARLYLNTIANLPPEEPGFSARLADLFRGAPYRAYLYTTDSSFRLRPYRTYLPADSTQATPSAYLAQLQQHLRLTPDQDNAFGVHVLPDDPRIYTLISLPKSRNAVRFVFLDRMQDELYAPIRTIRWIIYTGMFLSIGIVVLVSRIFARNLTRPIAQLTEAAQAIADGDTARQIHLRRTDEYGQLAQSLNRMAGTLRADNERLAALNTQLTANQARQQQFYADIAHEIRNPLHTVLASLELLQMADVPPALRDKHHANAQAQLQRIARLFNDLMTLQRYDADPHFVRPQPVAPRTLAGILQRVLDAHAPAAAAKGLAIQQQVANVGVLADPAKLEQVLDNLVGNAVKYTERGHVRLTVAPLAGGRVQFAVEDTGIGIAAEHLPRVTDRFYRTDAARARDATTDPQGLAAGTGLGLAVVQSILTAHGSVLHMASEPGRGSRFWFEL